MEYYFLEHRIRLKVQWPYNGNCGKHWHESGPDIILSDFLSNDTITYILQYNATETMCHENHRPLLCLHTTMRSVIDEAYRD
jgi:hypothetical protein